MVGSANFMAHTNLRFRNYIHTASGDFETAFHLYVFDLHLRALVMKVMSVVENELQLHLGAVQTDKRFLTFGALERTPMPRTFLLKNMGFEEA